MGFKQPENTVVNEKTYLLKEDYLFKSNEISERFFVYKVPEGYIWDGASISPLLAFFMRRGGLAMAASVLHDYMYEFGTIQKAIGRNKGHGYSTSEFADMIVSRKFADEMFYDALIRAGFPEWKAKIAYKCVRLFGKKYWNGLPESS
jgi:hypothetical protein